MTVEKLQKQNEMTLRLTGRLDTITAPQLEAELRALDPQVNEIVFDLAELVYLSSSGLRVIAAVQKKLAGHGKMTIRNARGPVMEVFEITGFTEVLTFE